MDELIGFLKKPLHYSLYKDDGNNEDAHYPKTVFFSCLYHHHH